MIQNNYEYNLKIIQKHFKNIFEKNAKVIYSDFPNSFDNFAIAFETDNFLIRFTRDRGTADIQIGTLEAETNWYKKDTSGSIFSLITIIMFLTKKQLLITGYWKFRYDLDKQLEQLAKVFSFFYDQIAELYKPGIFQKEKEELDKLNEEVLLIIYEPRLKNELKNLEEKSRKFWDSV